MKKVFSNKRAKLYIHVDDKKGIIDAVTLAKKHGINKITIVGGYESHKITGFLIKNNVSVLLQNCKT